MHSLENSKVYRGIRWTGSINSSLRPIFPIPIVEYFVRWHEPNSKLHPREKLTSMNELKLEYFLITSANIFCDSSCLLKYALYGSSVRSSFSYTSAMFIRITSSGTYVTETNISDG
jgi:hypothetical protein